VCWTDCGSGHSYLSGKFPFPPIFNKVNVRKQVGSPPSATGKTMEPASSTLKISRMTRTKFQAKRSKSTS
jgi:hypothetical protein